MSKHNIVFSITADWNAKQEELCRLLGQTTSLARNAFGNSHLSSLVSLILSFSVFDRLRKKLTAGVSKLEMILLKCGFVLLWYLFIAVLQV